MNKKLFAIPALLIAIGGGAVLAQSDLFVTAENNPAISASEAKNIALKQLDGEIIDFEYDGDDRTPHYEIDIIKGNEKIEVEINASTGEAKITERETIRTVQVEKTTATVAETPKTPTASTSSEQVEPKQSTTVANETVKPASQPVQPAVNEKKKATATMLTKQQAIQIAQSKASGKVTEVELDDDDNHLVYEIEIRNGKMEYDFEIDAKTGAILKYEEDLDDDDDNEDDFDNDDDDNLDD